MKFFNRTKLRLSDFKKLYKMNRLVYKAEIQFSNVTNVNLTRKPSLIFNIPDSSLQLL